MLFCESILVVRLKYPILILANSFKFMCGFPVVQQVLCRAMLAYMDQLQKDYCN
jgi:hypothetical protein